MTDKIDTRAANHLRKAIKELRWAAWNMEKYYNIVKPEEAPIIMVDKNQLSLLDEIERYGQES